MYFKILQVVVNIERFLLKSSEEDVFIGSNQYSFALNLFRKFGIKSVGLMRVKSRWTYLTQLGGLIVFNVMPLCADNDQGLSIPMPGWVEIEIDVVWEEGRGCRNRTDG